MLTQVVIESFTSRVLADNPLNDPVTRQLPIILPPDYDTAGKRYPVLYGLTGFTGSGPMMLNVSAWQLNLPQRIERLMAEGKLPPAIYVLPDCFTRYGGSQYLNSTAIGRYEDYVIDEIVPHIDRTYRTIAGSAGRGVFGKSSGGYGSIVLGMKHPDIFGAVACHSGDMYFDLVYVPDFPKFLTAIQKAGGLEKWWIEFERKPKKENRDIEAVDILAMAAAYSPNPSATPFPIDFPFDLETGELKPDVWARWLQLDPVRMVDRYADNLKKLRLLFIDCGSRDEFNLHFGARVLVKKLKALEVPHEHEEFDDGHMNIQYRYDVSLPKLVSALNPAE
ncbi:Endo-1,4-beta-xylanase/feruloyl esterase [Thermoflexales bacterium]|nr:Endo-1,4-beta-xylanase/feruloyl esterase [Thermoflexales bacterium]